MKEMNSFRCKMYAGIPDLIHPNNADKAKIKRKSDYIVVSAISANLARHYVQEQYASAFMAGHDDQLIRITASKIPTSKALEMIGAPSLFDLSDFDPVEAG